MKRIKRSISKILAAAFIITNIISVMPGISFAKSDSEAAAAQKPKIVKTDREKSEIIVKYKDDGKKASLKSNAKSKLKLSKLDTVKEYKKSKIDVYEIDSKKDDIDRVVEELRKDPDVEYVQPNYKLELLSVPTDERFAEQWPLSNSGQEIEGQTGRSGVDINAVNAWDLTIGSSQVVIGVLDTGIDISHNDLRDSIYTNSGEIPGNDLDDDGNGYIDDVNGWDFVNGDNTVYDDATKDYHGTHVAGIIAASSNSDGITGVAPNVRLLPLKFINGGYGYTCDAIDAIEYAMSMGVKIVNCSFGGTDNNFALKDTMVNSGILFICAGGNRGNDVNLSPVYPACFDIPNVLSVASIDSKGVLSPYSSYGSKIQVAAPGVNILSTAPGNNYDYLSGTSQSAPFVTGIAALVKSYLPDLTITDIAQRIKDNVVPCTNLTGKISAGGRVDAFAALTDTKPQTDTYTGPGNDNSTVPAGQQGGNEDTWYTLDQLAKIKEKLHYGEGGVNPASGNYSFSVNDMSMTSPGFKINISRSYNSRDDRSSLLGRGWTFGFQGKVEGTDVVEVTLPTGGAQRFRLENGAYTPEDSRSVFVKNADGTYLLTTKDQYRYTFAASGYLTKMEDRNGNAINIQVDANGKITQITDAVNRVFTVNYNSQNLIDSIVDPENRTVRYEYEANRLVRAIDPMGGIMRYYYDSWGYINEIKDQNDKTVASITYNHNEGENQHKVSQATDSLGDTVGYSYDMTNKKTTATDMNGRVSTYFFDSSMYTIQVQDPEGKSAYTEYFQVGGKNKYGDVQSTTDRYGNKTLYDIDDRGNVTKIINPDGTSKEYTYDDKNNLTVEKDELGCHTYYVYDTDKKLLLKKAQPLNGIDVYTEGCDESKFAVTAYQYFTAQEAQSLFGCSANSLLKSVTDPEGSRTSYTYDADGNIATTTDAGNNTKTDHYNRIGWKDYTISPEGRRTDYTYDKNGLLIKSSIANGNGETTRTVYDKLGRKTQEISPNQYNPAKDSLTDFTYGDAGVGARYAYYDSGKLMSETDALGNTKSYTYDVYGNTLTETKADGAETSYEYDILDRVKKVYFKDSANAAEVLLTEYSYAELADGKTQKTQIRYLNDTEKAVTVSIYDYAGRLVEQQNPDGTRSKTSYNANGTVDSVTAVNGSTTYFRYDGLNRLTEQWTPLEVSNGIMNYTYTKIEYDRAGKKLAEKTGKDKAGLFAIPSSFAVKNYTYYSNGRVKTVTDAEGRETGYQYDGDGNVVRQDIAVDAATSNTTEYVYNYMGKLTEQKVHMKKGDIYGNSINDTEDIALSTTYTYDKNGNVLTITTPDNVTTTCTYDALNRQLTVSKPGLDETGTPVTLTTAKGYDEEGRVLTSTDANGNVTTYEYDKRGLLIYVTDPKDGVTAYGYDRAGRKVMEVSPQNYSPSLPLSQDSRIEYVYDLMGRLKAKKDVYLDGKTGSWVTVYTKTYKYDNSGNVVKELDALGYEAGSGSTLDERINTGYGKEYTYNFRNMPITGLDAVSKERTLPFTTRYEYDGLGRKISETDARGVTTLYELDDAGNVKTTSVKKNGYTAPAVTGTADYDLAGRMTSSTDGNGNTTVYEYNALGKMSRALYPGDSTIPSSSAEYQYDVMGNLRLKQDSLGKVELYNYDSQGRMLAYTQEKSDGTESITTSAGYDRNGNKRFETDENGTVKENIYDGLNRLIQTKVSVNGTIKTITYGYDANGNQTSVTDWLGNTSTNLYDPLNRLTEKKDPYTTIQRLEYYGNSLQSASYDALGNETRYGYDSNGRLIYTVDPEGHSTSQSYDDAGNVRTKTDGRNISTTYNYDEFNRLKSVVNAKGENTSYTYDLNGNMLTQTDGNGNTTTFEYNAANKLARKIDQGGKLGSPGNYTYIWEKTESYTYYADGNIAAKVDRNGKTTGYSYDIHGSLLLEETEDTSVSYTYDGDGNQLTMTDSTGTTVRTYDEQGRVTTKTVPGFGVTTFVYDIQEGDGRYVETTLDPKGNLTGKTYDRAGRLIKVTAGGEDIAYEYYPDGSRKSVIYPDGSREDYTYYTDGLNRTLVNKKADGTVIDSYSYTYDAAHNQTSKTDSKGITTYIYDSLNRLERATEPSGKITSYTFDKAGNRLTESVTTGTTAVITTYTYNEQNRLISTVAQSGGTAEKTIYAYDGNGNTVSKSVETTTPAVEGEEGSFALYKEGEAATDSVTFYEYDAFNQLVRTVSGGTVAQYRYYGDGYRASKSVDGETTSYLYEGDKVILEVDGQGSQTSHNIYGTNLLARTMGGQTAYYMYNGHADVTALLGADGNILAAYYYDSFGNIVEDNEAEGVDNPYRYAGYVHDGETGLYYLNARYYDSSIARFITEDTYRGSAADPLSLNLYTYCVNNPIIYFDPTGHIVSKWDGDHLTDDELNQLGQLTRDWNDACARGDEAGMAIAHAKAEEIRNGHRSEGEVGSDTGLTYESGEEIGSAKEVWIYDPYHGVEATVWSDNIDANIANGWVDNTVKMEVYDHYHGNTGEIWDFQKGLYEGYGWTTISDYNTWYNWKHPAPVQNYGAVQPDDSLNVIGQKASDQWTGSGGGMTISSGILDPITQAAIKEAQGLLDGILGEYHPYEWPKGYSIGDYTWSAEYKTRYQNAVERAKDVASFFNTLDLADDIKNTYEELSGTGVSNPYTLAVSSVLIGAWRNKADKEPGIAELPDALGISGWLTRNIAKAQEESDFIDGSNYRYLVYSGQFLWEKGPRGMFIDNISNLEGPVTSRTETRYNIAQDNAKYKQAVLNYLGVIKNMNVNYNQSVSDMNFFLNEIDKKY